MALKKANIQPIEDEEEELEEEEDDSIPEGVEIIKRERKEAPKEIKRISEAKIIDVPSQYTSVIQLEDGTNISLEALIVKMYNDLKHIKKVIG